MTLEEIRGLLEKATPGPWKVDTTFAALEWIIIRPGSTGYGLATIWPRDVDFHVDAYEYGGGSPADNAALIAAAPDLAALLVRAVEVMQAMMGPHVSGAERCPACRGEESARALLRELEVEA